MSDLIDRNLIAELVDSHGNVHWEDIAELPPEQPEVRTQMSSADCISRQAAIEALKDMYHAAEKWGEEASDDVIKARAESCMASLIEMKLRIEKLPSAQPETPPYVAEIESEYKKCASMPHINKPLAKALYEVWKKHDREDVSRNG